MNMGIHFTLDDGELLQVPKQQSSSISGHTLHSTSLLVFKLVVVLYTTYIVECSLPKHFLVSLIHRASSRSTVKRQAALWQTSGAQWFFFREQRLPLWCPDMDTMLQAATHHDLRLSDSWTEMSASSNDSFKPLVITQCFFLPHWAFWFVTLKSF